MDRSQFPSSGSGENGRITRFGFTVRFAINQPWDERVITVYGKPITYGEACASHSIQERRLKETFSRPHLSRSPLRGQCHVGVEEGFFDAVAA
jgi:hypothetical protein